MANDRVFRVGVTPDVINSQGDLDWGGVTLNHLKQTPGIEVDYIKGNTQVLFPKQVKEFDAIFSFGCGYDRATFSDPDMRLVLIARFGVGYDNLDVQAATEAGVIITISPDGVRRPMATAILTFILALSHKLLIKDRLIRARPMGRENRPYGSRSHWSRYRTHRRGQHRSRLLRDRPAVEYEADGARSLH